MNSIPRTRTKNPQRYIRRTLANRTLKTAHFSSGEIATITPALSRAGVDAALTAKLADLLASHRYMEVKRRSQP